MTLSPDQAELLKAIANLYDGDELFYSQAMGAGETIEHPEKEGRIPVKLGALLELKDLGLIGFREIQHGGMIRLTGPGRAKVAELAEVEAARRGATFIPAEAKGMAFDWQGEVLPVLKAAVAANEHAQAHRGIMAAAINAQLGRDQNDPRTGRILEKLVEAKYLIPKLTADQAVGPLSVDLAPKALELLAGWPTDRGDIALGRLLQLLEERIEATEDPLDKTRLRGVVESVKNVGESVMARLLTEAVLGGP